MGLNEGVQWDLLHKYPFKTKNFDPVEAIDEVSVFLIKEFWESIPLKKFGILLVFFKTPNFKNGEYDVICERDEFSMAMGDLALFTI